jgi:hypothetical protein
MVEALHNVKLFYDFLVGNDLTTFLMGKGTLFTNEGVLNLTFGADANFATDVLFVWAMRLIMHIINIYKLIDCCKDDGYN